MKKWFADNKVLVLVTGTMLSGMAISCILYRLFGHHFIKTIYRGESIKILNRIIKGQFEYSLEYYYKKVDAIWTFFIWSSLLILFMFDLFILAVNLSIFQRIDYIIQKYKIVLLGVAILCLIAAHYWFLGFTTWDGFGYRIPPIVELVQHGDLGGEKFDTPWAQHFYPFFELVHAPFLKLFGLPGLFFSFSLTLFPLAIMAIYWFTVEVTHERRWATYSAMVYMSIPFINEQPFAGYVDFAVVGALAFFLFALLRVLHPEQPSIWSWVLFLVATLTFGMSRQHTPYLALLLAGSIVTWSLRSSVRLHLSRLPLLGLTFALGLAPALCLHIYRLLKFGSPLYPFQFKFLGSATSAGVPLDTIMSSSGLLAPTWKGLWFSFVRGWMWPNQLPYHFFDSRLLGIGCFFWITLITFPIICKKSNASLAFLVALLVVTELVIKDFWLPRYSVLLVLVVVLCVGGALARLATRGPHWAYATLLLVSILHLAGRPLYVGADVSMFGGFYARANFSDSHWFIARPPIEIYPDWGADLLIVSPIPRDFVLPLYGKLLSNQIIGKLDPMALDGSCTSLRTLTEIPQRKVLVIDPTNRLAGKCSWVCEMPRPWGCMAQRLASPAREP
jgi:hypothetical protein